MTSTTVDDCWGPLCAGIAKGGPCNGPNNLCLHGSYCALPSGGGVGQCQCNDKKTNSNTPKCDPRVRIVGGTCIASDAEGDDPDRACDEPEAVCNVKRICECNGGFQPEPDSLECQLEPGVSCVGERSGYCGTGSVCDTDNTCLPKVGELGGRCNGDKCNDPSALCENEDKECQCGPGFSGNPVNLTCAKSANQPCKEEKECTTELTCDSETSTCRVDEEKDCQGTKNIFCRSGTFCDWLGKCSEYDIS
ncbi:hypothetical protein ACOMHN_010147 [Nucella lapillus]